MRCDEARRRLLAKPLDRAASRHLEGCLACFEVLEAADPLVPALRGARPGDEPAPARLAAEVLTRWRPGRRRVRTALTGVLVATALAFAFVVEAFVGVEPSRLAGAGPAVETMVAGVGGALSALLLVRTALFDAPPLLTAFSAVTLAACALWLRLALRIPSWRVAR